MTKFSEQFDALAGQKDKIVKEKEAVYLKAQQDLFFKWWNKTKCEILWQLLEAKEAIKVVNPNYINDGLNERGYLSRVKVFYDYKIFKKMCAERGFILKGEQESSFWSILRAENQNPEIEDEVPEMTEINRSKNVVAKPKKKKSRGWWQKLKDEWNYFVNG